MPSTIMIRGKLFGHLNRTNLSPFLLSMITRKLSCWKCGSQHESGLHCASCKALQEPSEINYFELMNVDVSYDIDAKSLVPRYHSLQILYHPDKQSGENEVSPLLLFSFHFISYIYSYLILHFLQENKKKSETFSTAVNKAYSTLNDPIERALYILKLNGITLDETTSNQNPELLMIILEFNDDIARVKCGEDAQKIKKNVDKEIKELSRYSHLLITSEVIT